MHQRQRPSSQWAGLKRRELNLEVVGARVRRDSEIGEQSWCTQLAIKHDSEDILVTAPPSVVVKQTE
jgi:hypothetical protein